MNPQFEFLDQELQRLLLAPHFDLSDFHANAPGLGGVYAVWGENEKTADPIYCGESCNLRDRGFEISVIGRHAVVSKILTVAGKLLETDSGRERSSKLRLLKYRVSWIIMPIGRKELEEYLIWMFRPKLNASLLGRFRGRDDFSSWESLVSEKINRTT